MFFAPNIYFPDLKLKKTYKMFIATSEFRVLNSKNWESQFNLAKKSLPLSIATAMGTILQK